MTDDIKPSAETPCLASRSASTIFDEFIASPMGHRFRHCDPSDLWVRLRPAIRLAAAIELAGLSERTALQVHYVGHGYDEVIDEGRWLQLAKCFLGAAPRLDITMRSVPAVERSRTSSRSVLAAFVENLPAARRRAATVESLFEPLIGRPDLVVFSTRPAVYEDAYRPFMDVVPANVPIVLADEVDAATLGLCESLEALGASVPRVWIMSLDDPEAPGQSDDEWLSRGALIAHIATHPTSTPAASQWARYRKMIGWAIADITRARNVIGAVPMWPGEILTFGRDDGSTYEIINAHPTIPIHATTGEPMNQPRGQAYRLPAALLARHPGKPDPATRNRFRPEDFAWSLEASAALDECQDAILQDVADLQSQIDARVELLGERAPAALPEELSGLLSLVHQNNAHALHDRIILSRANPDQRGAHGITPLMLAARLGRVDCLTILLECHADQRVRDEHGWTALAHAAYAGYVEAVGILLRYRRGAHIALRSGLPDVVFCIALLDVQREQRYMRDVVLPDPAPMIAAWRQGTVLADTEPMNAFLLGEMHGASGTIRAEPRGPQLQTLHGLPHGPLAITREPDGSQVSPLSMAVRRALKRTAPALPDRDASSIVTSPAASIVGPESSPVLPSIDDLAPAMTVVYESTDSETPAQQVVAVVPAAPVPGVSTPRVAGTMAVVATVAGTLGHLHPEASPLASAQVAKESVLDWLRADKHLPIGNHVDDVFQLDLPNATVLSDAVDGLWTLRYDDQDRAVPGRTWRTEIVIATNAGKAFASLRLVRISPSSDDYGAAGASIPRLVSRLAGTVGLSDAGVPLRADPWAIVSSDGVEALSRLLLNPSRLQPVLVVTSPDPAWIGRTRDQGSLAARLHGFVHFVVVDPAMTFPLSRELGRPLGVFGDACRLYRPGFTLEDDAQSNPLFLRRAGTPDRPFAARIVQSAAGLSPVRATEDDVPTFGFARALMAKARQAVRDPLSPRSSAERPSDLIHSLEASLAAITEECNMWQESHAELDTMARSREAELLLERESLREEVDRLRSQNWHLRAQSEQLRTNLARKAGAEDALVSYPDSWDELETWAADVLGDDVVLTSKAVRAARKSPFQNIALAYRALHLLKEDYLPMRLDRTPERLAAFDSRCRELGVEISDTGQAVDDRRYKDAYRVSWMGKTYKLDHHLSGSSARDPTRQLRCYFAYDQDQGCIIVGSLPEHLDNSLTRH